MANVGEKDEDGDEIVPMNPRRTQVMMAQYKRFHTCSSPHQIAIPDEKNMNVWYVLICGLGDNHEFGEYIVKFKAGPEFPRKPQRTSAC